MLRSKIRLSLFLSAQQRCFSQQLGKVFNPSSLSVEEKIRSCIILAAVGDAIGFRNGTWEFLKNGQYIHNELQKYYGGLSGINIKKWRVSDDTIMHLATARAIIEWRTSHMGAKLPFQFDENSQTSCDQFFVNFVDPIMKEMAKQYIICWGDMDGRAPGLTCQRGIDFLVEQGTEMWYANSYEAKGGGCGGSMRSMVIGSVFYGQNYRDMLIAASIESGRLTHNHANGFLGALVSSVFTAFAMEGIPPAQWGVTLLFETMPRARLYLERVGVRDWKKMERDVKAFEDKFAEYLRERGLYLDVSEFNKERCSKLTPNFPSRYGISERDDFYKRWSYSGWAGSSGDDSCIIAYDSILYAEPNNYETMILHSALHAGDSDSTGTIAAAWFGANHGFLNVIPSHWEEIEKKQEMIQLSSQLCQLFSH